MFFADRPATQKFTAQYKEGSKLLDLTNQSLTGDDMPALADFLKSHPSITELHLNHNRVGSGLRHLTCKRIEHLYIKHNELTDEHIVQFARALLAVRGPQNHLESLSLENNRLGDAAAAGIAQFDQPLSLYLDNNQIGVVGATELSKNEQWFKVVSLMDNPLPAAAVPILTQRFDGTKGIGFHNAPAEADRTPSCWSCFCS